MIIYHGSEHVIKKPEYGKGEIRNDYGRGFYCTENIELAKEWAAGKGTDGYANVYEFDDRDLKVLDLNSGEYDILTWLAILVEHRTYWQSHIAILSKYTPSDFAEPAFSGGCLQFLR